MPIKYKYHKEKDILLVTVEGELSLDDLDRFMNDITRSTEFPPDIKSIWDTQKATFASYNTGYVEKYISIRKKYPERGNARIAVVADKDLSFGMARKFEMLSDILPQRMEVFRDFSKAEEWLLTEE